VVPEWSRRAIPTHNGRGILSILPPLKMSGLKIDSQFESERAILWGKILPQAAKLSPKKSPLLKKGVCHS
jgi:hypothetical protein